MKLGLKNWLRRRAVLSALKKPAPRTIPLNGPRAQARDYFTCELGEVDGSRWRFLVLTPTPEGFEGYWFDDSDSRTEVSVPNSVLSKFRLRITRYYKGSELRYYGAVAYFALEFAQWPFLSIQLDKVAQKLFNRRSLFLADRMKLLRRLVQETLKNRHFSTSEVGVMSLLYDIRWVRHPDREAVQTYYALLLDSLVASADLSREQHVLRVRPQALATLHTDETDQRKHRDQIRMQVILAALTAGLLLIGALQVGVTLWPRLPTAANVPGLEAASPESL